MKTFGKHVDKRFKEVSQRVQIAGKKADSVIHDHNIVVNRLDNEQQKMQE